MITPEPYFTERLERVFGEGKVTAHDIQFENPLAGGYSYGAVYVARRFRE